MTRPVRWAILFVVLFVVSSVAAVMIVLWSLSGVSPFSRAGAVLSVKLEGAVAEVSAHDSLSRLFGRETADFRDILDGIEKARTDSKIQGLYLQIDRPGLGFAQNEEVRTAIDRFRKSGKWAWAFLETAGEFSSGNGSYLLASACDKIVLAPPGDLSLTSLRAETPFVLGLLEKLKVVPQFGQRKEFKNAADTFLHKDYTPAHREATGRLLNSLYEDMVAAVAKGRRISVERARELISGGPYTAPEAQSLHLVDELAYRDEMTEQVEKQAGSKHAVVNLSQYLRGGRPHDSGWRKIAVVYAIGGVSRGKSGSDMINGDVMGSDTIAKALRTAREDSGVAAVVMRVDSPGGSYVASDVIRREVELTRKVKPLVVSMGNVAASGGYFVSMDAGKIFADSGTITGSIGVFGGKLVTHGMWEDKLGINWSGIQTGDNADIWSTQTEYSAKGWERMNSWLDRIYADFTTKAAKGRGMQVTELEPLAHGRVWSGKDALERKLIDRIGGLSDALDEARQEAGIAADTRYSILILPEPTGFLGNFFNRDETFALPPEARQALRALALVSPQGDERLLLDPTLPQIH